MTSARFYHLSETMHAPEHLDHQPDIRAPSSARLRANSVRSTVSPASAKQNYEGPGRTGCLFRPATTALRRRTPKSGGPAARTHSHPLAPRTTRGARYRWLDGLRHHAQ